MTTTLIEIPGFHLDQQVSFIDGQGIVRRYKFYLRHHQSLIWKSIHLWLVVHS